MVSKIYLSGKMTGLTLNEMNSWRDNIEYQIHNYLICDVVNPVNYYNTNSYNWDTDSEYIRWELRQVKSSDVVIVGWNNAQDSIGTISELTYAFANQVPIILYMYETNRNDFDLDKIHPFIKYMSDKIFCADEQCRMCKYIKKYFI